MTQMIWLGILDSDRHYRYYFKMAIKFRRLQTRLDVCLLVVAVAIAVVLATQFTEGFAQQVTGSVLVAVLGVVTAWQWRKEYGTKAAVATIMSNQYKMVSDDWKRLWFQGDNDVLIAVLQERLISISSQYDLPSDERLAEEAEKESDIVVYGELAPATL